MTSNEFYKLLSDKQIEWLEGEILNHEDNDGLPERSGSDSSYRSALIRFANDLYKEMCSECDGSGENPMYMPPLDDDEDEEYEDGEDIDCEECDGDGYLHTYVYEGMSKVKGELFDKYEDELIYGDE